jgi:putative chitinase
MYLAEVFHESGNLRYTEENMNYSADGLLKTWPSRFTKEKAQVYARNPEKIANYVYASRMGNGNEASGDGWRFRGRAFIGITGRDNYQKYADSEWCVVDLMKNPDMLSKFPENQKASMWFWDTQNLNKYADMCDIDKCSRIINGGTLGLSNRKFLYRRFCREFGVKKI